MVTEPWSWRCAPRGWTESLRDQDNASEERFLCAVGINIVTKGEKQLHTLKASANSCEKQQYLKLLAKGNLQVLPVF